MKRLLRRGLLAVCLFFSGVCLSPAQPITEAPPDASAASEFTPFAIEPLRNMAANKDIFWRPDWALAMPVDAFELVAGSPRPRAITVSLDEAEYRVAWQGNGSLAAFPTFVNGIFVQLTLTGAGFIVAGEPHCTLTFIDAAESGAVPALASPFLAKIAPVSGAVYLAALDFVGDLITETWYDADGNAIALFSSRLASLRAGAQVPVALESRVTDTLLSGTAAADGAEYNTTYEYYNYDSFGNITAIESARGTFTAVYVQPHRPRYSETVVNGTRWRYTFQWDDAGRLTRLTGDRLTVSGANAADGAPVSGANAADGAPVSGGSATGANAAGDAPVSGGSAAGANAAGDAFIDLRYDYTFDAHGNWVARRETRMIRQLGALIPSVGATVKRRIEYGARL